MTSKKVLYYTIEGYDTPNPSNHLMDGIIEAILESGHQCHLMQSCRGGENKSVPSKFEHNPSFSTTVINRKKVNKLNFIKRYLEESFFSINIIKHRKNLRDCDVILMQSTATSISHLLLLKLFIRKPIIYNIYDIFPGHAYDIGVIKSKSLYNILKKLQFWAYKLCDKIVVMSEDMENKLKEEGIKQDKIKIIYNWFDDSKFCYIEKANTKIFKNFNLSNDYFYLQYAGTLGQVFDEKILIDLAQALLPIEQIRILLIGEGVKTNWLKQKTEELKLTNVIFLPLQPLEIINDVYNACDMGLIPLKRGVIGYGFPSKACQLLACSKPIYNICDESCYKDIFKKYNMGISNTEYDVKKIKEDIVSMMNSSDILKEMGNNGKQYVYEQYSKTKNSKKFVTLCLEIIKGD